MTSISWCDWCPLNTSPHPHLPNNHLAGTSGLVTVKMQHSVALLNPLSWPITQEPSQETLVDTEEGLKVAWACLHYWGDIFPPRNCCQSRNGKFLKRANENRVWLMEVILTVTLSLFYCSDCQKPLTFTETNAINPQRQCLHADATKDPVIKVQKDPFIISSLQLNSQMQIKPDWTGLILSLMNNNQNHHQ